MRESGVFAHDEDAGGVLIDGALEGDPFFGGEKGAVKGGGAEVGEVGVVGVDEVGEAGEVGVEEGLGGEGEGEFGVASGEVGKEEAADLVEDERGVVKAGRDGAAVAEDGPAVEGEDAEPVEEHDAGVFLEEVEADVDFLDVELGEVAFEFLAGAAVGAGEMSAFDERNPEARSGSARATRRVRVQAAPSSAGWRGSASFSFACTHSCRVADSESARVGGAAPPRSTMRTVSSRMKTSRKRLMCFM